VNRKKRKKKERLKKVNRLTSQLKKKPREHLLNSAAEEFTGGGPKESRAQKVETSIRIDAKVAHGTW